MANIWLTRPMTTSETTASHPVGFNLALIAVLLAALGLGLAYGVDALRQRQNMPASLTDDTELLTRTMGGRELTIPRRWFRFDEQAVDGFVGRIELALPLTLGPDKTTHLVEVTLLPPSRARPSASLLDGVYLHRFMPNELFGPPGLIGKPLYAADGFAGETVWYDALSPDPFVTKCSAPVTGEGPDRCLRTVVLAPGIAAVYAFDASLLAAWREFDAAVKPWLVRIGALSP